MTATQKRRVVNGTWYEVCVSQSGEIRDVVTESTFHDAERRTESLMRQWPDCERVFVRQHTAEPERGPGCSKYHVIPALDFDFRVVNK